MIYGEAVSPSSPGSSGPSSTGLVRNSSSDTSSIPITGYSDIQMVFIKIYVSFYMIFAAYVIGKIVKGLKTGRFRDKLEDPIKYMNMNRLEKGICQQIERHVRLQYESSTSAYALKGIPVSIRAKISESLYKPYIENIQLFKGCSSKFIHEIVIRLHEVLFLPGEVILEQDNEVDQLYFVDHGLLEGVRIGEDGTEETILQFGLNSSFGEIAILCNLPQIFTVRVCERCKLLQLDKQSFTNILKVYFVDAKTVLSNILESGANNVWIKQLESDFKLHIGRQKYDYDGRSPLHIAASRGYEDIVLFLRQEGDDKYGSTPLLEAITWNYDLVVSLLFNKGAKLDLNDAANQLCEAVSRGDLGFLRRVLSCGADPNSKSKHYDHRTPLHIAACKGLYLMTMVLLEAGASVFTVDRRGTTPLDEARKRGRSSFLKLFEDAKFKELLIFPYRSQEKRQRRKCTIFPFHPWGPTDERREGIVIWIPQTMKELIKSAEQQLKCSGTCILSEEGGKIFDVDLISDGQRLYMPEDSDLTNVN